MRKQLCRKDTFYIMFGGDLTDRGRERAFNNSDVFSRIVIAH